MPKSETEPRAGAKGGDQGPGGGTMGSIRKGKPSKHFLAWSGKLVRLIDFPSMVKSVRQSGKEVFKHAVLCRVCALLCAVLYAVREID